MTRQGYISLGLVLMLLVSVFNLGSLPVYAQTYDAYVPSGNEVSDLVLTQEGNLINDHQVGFMPPVDAEQAKLIESSFSGWLVMYSTKDINQVWTHLQGLSPDEIIDYSNTSGTNRIYKITNYGWADGLGNTYRANQRDVVTGAEFGPGVYHLYVATMTTQGIVAIAEADKTIDKLPTPKNVNLNGDGSTSSAYSVTFESYSDERIIDNLLFFAKQTIYDSVILDLYNLDFEAIQALDVQKRAQLLESLSGEHSFEIDQLDIEGNPLSEGIYYVYVATVGQDGILGISYAKKQIITADLPQPVTDMINNGEGATFAIGGATSQENYNYFKALIGLEKPKVAVFSSSRDDFATVLNHYYYEDPIYDSLQNNWLDRGFEPVFIPLAIDNRDFVANHDYYASLVRTCDAVWLQGGDQNKHAKSLLNDDGTETEILKAIKYVHARGGVIAGTSAGMHVLSDPVFGYGTSEVALNTNQTEAYQIADIPTTGDLSPQVDNNNLKVPGINLMPENVLNDTHFDARGRLGRLIVGLRDTQKTIGVASDEGTGLAIRDNIGTVNGSQGVFIVDVSNAQFSPAGSDNQFEAIGVTIHYLTDGDTFNFDTKEILVRSDKPLLVEDDASDLNLNPNIFGPYETTKSILALAKSSNDKTSGLIKNTTLIASFYKDEITSAYQTDLPYQDSLLNGYKKITITNLKLNIEMASTSEPMDVREIKAGRADGSGPEYAATIEFSQNLKIGFSSSTADYLNDLEPPEHFVEVIRADNTLEQSLKSLRIIEGKKLEIVLAEQDFYDGDQLRLKTSILDQTGSPLEREVVFVYINSAWHQSFEIKDIKPGKVDGSASSYAVTITFNNPIKVGYSGASGDYINDTEEHEFFASLYRGKDLILQDSSSLKIVNGNQLQIVTKTDDFVVGDILRLENTITDSVGQTLKESLTYTYTGSSWTSLNRVMQLQMGKSDGSGTAYAVTITFEKALKVGYVGSKGDYLNDTEAPEYFVGITREGEQLEQGSSTLMIQSGNQLEVVLKVDDFEEMDKLTLYQTIEDTQGGRLIEPLTYVFYENSFIPYLVPVTGITLNKNRMPLTPGTQDKLIATLTPLNASVPRIIWTVDKPEVAQVDASGKLTGLARGTAYVTATTADGRYLATAQVIVRVVSTSTSNEESNPDNDKVPFIPTEKLDELVTPQGALLVSFSDLNGYEWAHSAIQKLFELGIVRGKTNNQYAPTEIATRAEFATMLVRALKLRNTTVPNQYYDVDKTQWFFEAVLAVMQEGLMKGTTSARFNPSAPISREEVFTILGRILERRGISLHSESESIMQLQKYMDAHQVAGWAKEGTLLCLQENLIEGKSNDNNPGLFLEPKAQINRAELAVILARVF